MKNYEEKVSFVELELVEQSCLYFSTQSDPKAGLAIFASNATDHF